MNHFSFVNKIRHEFFQKWVAYTTLILGINLTVSLIIIPVLNWLTARILQLGRIDYVSYTNVGNILITHPIVSILLVAMLILALLFVYWQFTFLMLGIYHIRMGHGYSVREMLADTLSLTPSLSLSSFGFFLGYFILILPFSEIGFKTALLAKVKIPDFILTYINANPWLLLLLTIAYLIVLYLGIRLLFVLPNLVISQHSVRQAIAESWRKTRGKTWSYFLNIAILSLMISIAALLCYSVILIGQALADGQTTAFALTVAVINLVLIELVAQFVVIFSTFGLMRILLNDLLSPVRLLPSFIRKRRKPRVLIIGAMLLVALSVVTFNVVYLQGFTVTKPLEISHRGVDSGNGVQNTIPALKKTSKEHPDYVEMDIHETKDHQFVVMHDENLKQLTGVNRAPYQMTLKQLTALTAHENGYSAKVASFDDYLTAAESIHQKLLVEIKVTSHDSSNMLKLFTSKYAKRLRTDHDEIHSLSYSVVKGLKQTDPKQYVSFILPYNLAFPHTPANGYTMEYSTLNDDFVDEANANHQRVYAWTVNSDTAIQAALFQNVNGIITDHLHDLQVTVNDNINHPTYTTRLLDYIIDIPSTNMPLN